MVSVIQLNQMTIGVYSYVEDQLEDRHQISVSFKVTSEMYHDIATLLYKEVFDVCVPERKLQFKGKITNYYTSITNLYEQGQVGDYHVTLTEVESRKETL